MSQTLDVKRIRPYFTATIERNRCNIPLTADSPAVIFTPGD